MDKKGLCSTCVNVKTCIFAGKSLVVECEEFSDIEPKCKEVYVEVKACSKK